MTKTVLVTGASSGFGEACVKTYALQGYKVVMGARNLSRLTDINRQLPDPSNTVFAPLDVRDKTSIEHFFDAIPEPFRDIDILVNNAGLALGVEPAQDADWDDWETMIDTNIKGLARITRKVLPEMVARNSGHIVNIGSMAASWPYPGGNAYGASKAFVQQFSRGLRSDVLGKQIRITNIEPGLANTNFSKVRLKGDQEKADDVYQNTQPLVAEDIANIVHWVTSVPAHVNINNLEVMPTCQAWGPLMISRDMMTENV
ncbi:MAG: SDR family NAD(P)-dependent oxidoreductase [Agarilytica sp.]